MNAEREALRQQRSFLMGAIKRGEQIPGMEHAVEILEEKLAVVERKLSAIESEPREMWAELERKKA